MVLAAGTYVASPLVWGVHTSSKRPTDSEGNVFGISRFGSGSHIMAKVDKDKVDGDLAFKVRAKKHSWMQELVRTRL